MWHSASSARRAGRNDELFAAMMQAGTPEKHAQAPSTSSRLVELRIVHGGAKHANAAPMSGPSQLFEAACFARSTGEPRTALPAIDACAPRSRSGPLRSACFSSSNATQALGPTWQGMDAQSSQSVLGDGLAAHAGDGGLATASLSYGHWPLSQHSIALPARPRCSTAGTRGLHWQVPRASPSGLAGRFAS